VAAATLNVWTPHWAFSTPVFLRPVGLWGTVDVWGGSIVGQFQTRLVCASQLNYCSPRIRRHVRQSSIQWSFVADK
jgi:hypothetical protein